MIIVWLKVFSFETAGLSAARQAIGAVLY